MIVAARKAVVWWVIVLLCAALGALAWRGYLQPTALIEFANQRLC